MQVNFEDIPTEGITKITDADIRYAQEAGMAIKMFGTSKKVGDKVFARVSPMLVSRTNPLFSVNGVFNSIFVKGNLLGEVMFYGPGAGKLPTASAVVGDIVDAVKHLGTNIMQIWSSKQLELADISESKNRYFVRIPKAEAEKVSEVFGRVRVIDAGVYDDYGFITLDMTEAEYREKAKNFNVRNMIRVTF